jgi:hypothetical protein
VGLLQPHVRHRRGDGQADLSFSTIDRENETPPFQAAFRRRRPRGGADRDDEPEKDAAMRGFRALHERLSPRRACGVTALALLSWTAPAGAEPMREPYSGFGIDAPAPFFAKLEKSSSSFEAHIVVETAQDGAAHAALGFERQAPRCLLSVAPAQSSLVANGEALERDAPGEQDRHFLQGATRGGEVVVDGVRGLEAWTAPIQREGRSFLRYRARFQTPRGLASLSCLAEAGPRKARSEKWIRRLRDALILPR